MKKIISMLFATLLVIGFTSNANAAKTLKCQTVISAKADEVVMLKDFTDTVTAVTVSVKSLSITTSSALALITVWHFSVFAALALDVNPITKSVANNIEMIFFIIFPLVS